MRARIPDEIAEYWDAEDMSGVLWCLGDAGWLRNGESSASLEVHFSEKGKALLHRLCALVQRDVLQPSGLATETPQSSDCLGQVPAIFEQVYLGPLSVAPELFLFLFSAREGNAAFKAVG